jgi:hypothetical protein
MLPAFRASDERDASRDDTLYYFSLTVVCQETRARRCAAGGGGATLRTTEVAMISPSQADVLVTATGYVTP